MKKLLFLSTLLLALTGCHDPRLDLDYIYDGTGYYGDELAGRTFYISHVELGIGSTDFVEVSPQSLEISFDVFAEVVAGNKNCNSFSSNVLWYDFGLVFDFLLAEDFICEPFLGEFPEGISLSGAFDVEFAFDGPYEVLILHNRTQDVSLYFYQR